MAHRGRAGRRERARLGAGALSQGACVSSLVRTPGKEGAVERVPKSFQQRGRSRLYQAWRSLYIIEQ